MERRLFLVLPIVLLLVPGLGGCRSGPATHSGHLSRTRHSLGERPIRVFYCSVGYSVGYRILEIDAVSGLLDVYREDALSHKWSHWSVRIPESELSPLLREISKEELLAFKPRSEWFVGSAVPDIGAGTMSFAWSDDRAVFAIPPKHVRARLASEARAVYASIDALEEMMVSLSREPEVQRRRAGLLDTDSSVAAALRKCNALYKDRLPAKVDW